MSNWDNRRRAKARLLLPDALPRPGGVWADIGCGDGVFTALLCECLVAGSRLIAVDKSRRALRALRRNLAPDCRPADLSILRADFTAPLSLPPLDGLVMANALHFVRDNQKEAVLARLATHLAPGATLYLIEYNASRGNFAVPHPIAAERAADTLRAIGFQTAGVVRRAPSSFLNELYTVRATWA